MPYNAEAEKAVLYCLIADQEKAQRINEIEDADFYNTNHLAIFNAIQKCVDDKNLVDTSALGKYLDETLMTVVANEIIYSQATSGIFSHYLKILKEYSKRRKLISLTSEIMKSAYDTELDLEETLLNAESSITAIDNYSVDEFKTAYDIFQKFHNELSERARNKNALPGIPTGFTNFDDMTGGLIGGYLYIIAARPAMGKTALASNIAMHVSKQDKPVAIFSLEMSDSLVMQRLIAEEAVVGNTNMKLGLLKDSEWSMVVNSAKYIAKRDFFIDDTAGINADQITMKCRRINNLLAKQNKRLELIVVDYLQIMTGKHKDQRLNVEDNCRKLKVLSKDLNVPVILLSQLNRANESRDKNDKRPSLADLRDSGTIEQDADLVAMIYRDEYYNADTDDKGISEIIFCKQRDGATGTIKLGWDGERTRFYNLKK